MRLHGVVCLPQDPKCITTRMRINRLFLTRPASAARLSSALVLRAGTLDVSASGQIHLVQLADTVAIIIAIFALLADVSGDGETDVTSRTGDMAHRRTEPIVQPDGRPLWRPFDVEGRRAELQKNYISTLSTVPARAHQASAASPRSHVIHNATHVKSSNAPTHGNKSAIVYKELKDLDIARITARGSNGAARKAGIFQCNRQGPIGEREMQDADADADENAAQLWISRMLALCRALVEDESPMPEALGDFGIVSRLECVRQAAKEALTVAGDGDDPNSMDVDV
ncbi:hypothetical protein CkaCkLH20_13278 [Colletotrichum karsti]|uniref:Uncharacterized protein n=1 Tax=Colletotrichum karsti TaxID=1095194 RepID=A0A9P6HZR7_9PEZI|nr:uncharacterized protein CkaCkLH20_13278 [Colletotrichum karsti]KAF9869245.1 hypothetical protein CkaCkLH20_13278 [Colletotrichum karsti]